MSKGTRLRAIRIPDALWEKALDKTRSEGTTVTAVVVAALREYTGVAANTTPQEPEPS